MAQHTRSSDDLILEAENSRGSIIFKTGAGVERARIDAAGNASGLFGVHSVSAADSSITVGGTAANPTVLAAVDRDQICRTARGLISENAPVHTFINGSGTTNQMVYGALMGLRAGDVVTGVMLRNNVAASGTTPTTVRAGIADSTGKMLAISGNLNAAASWPAGAVPLAFSGQYTVLSDGGYYGVFVHNGVWGSSNPSLVRGAVAGNFTLAYSTFPPPAFQWASQTDLPAVNSSLTITAGTSADFYMAFY